MALRRSLLQGYTVSQHHTPPRTAQPRIARKGWKVLGPTDLDKQIHVVVAVKQRNTEALKEKLDGIATPGSPQYGEFLTNAEVNHLVAPATQSIGAVSDWLVKHGATDVEPLTPNADFIGALMTAEQASKLVGGSYVDFRHTGTGAVISRLEAPAYSVHSSVAPHIDFVSPTITFPMKGGSRGPYRDDDAQGLPSKTITPEILRGMYNLTDDDVGRGDDSVIVQGVASFLEQYYAPSDLVAFRAKYRLGDAATLTDVPDPQLHTPGGVEASLEVQWITTRGDHVNTEHWYTSGRAPDSGEDEPFVAWLTDVASDDTPPHLFSISYGDEEDGVTDDYALRCQTEFMKAGARGITLLAASGDGGVGCSSMGFVPTFPASCPYVTAVGATTGGTGGESPTGESVADLSGGGFSAIFTRPSYQDDAVSAYMASGAKLPSSRNYNGKGAGFPDIAAQGLRYDTCTDDFYPISGTSAACPAATGIMSILAQARMDATGNSTGLGWINPTLYSLGADDVASGNMAFNDVTDGTNTYCGADNGFPAAAGWDPVTGWGTLNFGKLKSLFEAL